MIRGLAVATVLRQTVGRRGAPRTDAEQAQVETQLALLYVLRQGLDEVTLSEVVVYAAALRIAHFHTSNEFGDWDTALHTLTFANAVHQGLCRLHADGPSERKVARTDLLRGVFDAAMSIYLNRFLNIPAARIPEPATIAGSLDQLEVIFDKQHQVQAAAEAVSAHLYHDSNAPTVIMMLGKQLLREDRDFHTIQMFEATLRQVAQSKDSRASHIVLIAAARYLAAHAPTMRAQGQTFNIALRLAHGDRLFEE